MSTEGTSRPSIKVTDKRLFTEEGDLRDPDSVKDAPPDSGAEPKPDSPIITEGPGTDAGPGSVASEAQQPPTEEQVDGEVTNPGTMFASFIDSLVVNAYMALGMVRHPYRTEQEIDIEGARQMIDIIEMLGEKTKGNLTPEESKYLKAHLGELKLAFVRRSQSIG